MNELTSFAQSIQTDFSVNFGIIPVTEIPFRPELRQACAQNVCGNYGKNWMCPPLVGEIEDLIARAKAHEHALIYNKVFPLEDSFDFEGMMAGQKQFKQDVRGIAQRAKAAFAAPLLLGAGGCEHCEECAAKRGEPCVSPENAMASLESYGIQVSTLAALCGLNYIGGQNTVTYFGGILV